MPTLEDIPRLRIPNRYPHLLNRPRQSDVEHLEETVRAWLIHHGGHEASEAWRRASREKSIWHWRSRFSATKHADTERIKDQFSEFLAAWNRDKMFTSDANAILMHPAHYAIIGLGPPALPLIFRDLEAGGGPWFVALSAMTHANPIPSAHSSDARLMREDWLRWGRENDYLT